MQVPGFVEDVTGGPDNGFSFGEGCDTTRILNLENTFAREFRGIDVRLTAIEAVLPHLATKADLSRLETRMYEMQASLQAEISGLRGEMQAEIGGLRGEMQAEIGGLRSEIGGLRSEMHTAIADLRSEMQAGMGRLQATLMKWFLASTFTTITVVALITRKM